MKKLFYFSLLGFTVVFSCNQSKTSASEKPIAGLKEEVLTSSNNDIEQFGFIDLAKEKSMEAILCQHWTLQEDYEDARFAQGKEVKDPVYRGFRFYSDKKVIKNPHTDYEIGNWSLKEIQGKKIIRINFPKSTSESYIIAYLNPFSLKLVRQADASQKILEYAGNALAFANKSHDPFALQNNNWRQKPNHSETDANLKKRLKDNIHFYVLFYNFNINAKLQTVNFTGLPTCFTWYAGGIYLKKKEELKPAFLNCFYSETQAMQAFGLADRLMNYSYTWPKNETNWLKQNVFVLKQMEQKLDSLH